MTDIMIDIETLNTTPDSIILSIAALSFERDSNVGDFKEKFMDCINIEQPKRSISHDTLVNFHFQLPSGVNSYLLTEDTFTLDSALCHLGDFIIEEGRESGRIWANGSGFDMGILEHAYDQVGQSIPWKFYQVRDLRTFIDVMDAKEIRNKYKDEAGDLHNPLVDCEWQTRVLQTLTGALPCVN